MNLLRSTILSILMIAFLIGCESSTSTSSDSSSSVASSSSSVVKSSSSSAKSSSSVATSSSSVVKSSSSSAKSSSSEAMSSSSSAKSSSSNAISSSSSSSIVYSTIKDARDNQTYRIVTIGSQTWMAENLNFEYKVGPATYANYFDSNHPEFGRFYSWAAAMDSAGVFSKDGEGCGNRNSCTPATTVRGLCPEGFRMPSQIDFDTLVTAIGGALMGTKKLKSTGGWSDDGNGTDNFGFSALAVGRFDCGSFVFAGEYASFWSSNGATSEDMAWQLLLLNTTDNLAISPINKSFGHSVRCIKSN